MIFLTKLFKGKEKTLTEEEKFNRETASFLSWILESLLWKMRRKDIDEDNHTVIVKEVARNREYILFSHIVGNEDISTYSTKYILGDNFYNVMSRVIEILNSSACYKAFFFPKSESKGSKIVVTLKEDAK